MQETRNAAVCKTAASTRHSNFNTVFNTSNSTKVPNKNIQSFLNLPTELLNQPRWIRTGENKIPWDENWSDLSTQHLVSDIQAPLKGFDISGHGVNPDYLVLDFDHVLTDNGKWINDYAKNVFNWITSSVPTYVERSISKTGFHMVYKPTEGALSPLNSSKTTNIFFLEDDLKSKMEVFYKTSGRQFIFTGDCEGLCSKRTKIASGEQVDNFLQRLIKEIHYLHNYQNKAIDNETQSNSFELNAQNANLWVENVLNLINVEQLNRMEWVNTGTSLKQLGISFEVFDQWSSQDTGLTSDGKKNRYDERDCEYQWNSFNENGDINAAVGQIISLAKRNDPQGFKKVWHEVEDIELNRMKSTVMQVLDESNKPILMGSLYGESLKTEFDKNVEIRKDYASRKTGFSKLDHYQIFAPGVYVITAPPAEGKTTFAHQLAMQIVTNNVKESAIFISYEMSAHELNCKQLARTLKQTIDQRKIENETAKKQGKVLPYVFTVSDVPLSSTQISIGRKNTIFEEVLKSEKQKHINFRTYEARGINIDSLLKQLKNHLQLIPEVKSPVVVIDYIGVIPHTNENHRLGIDDIINKLKTFQRETNTTFIVISAMNRQNYKTDSVQMDSFKESGGIEYTADVAWALIRKNKDNNAPRSLVLKCLKNRFGYDSYAINFNYWAEFDLFEENMVQTSTEKFNDID